VSAEFARRRVRPPADFLPWQEADLESLGLTEHDCQTAVQWVDASGTHAGGRAVSRALLKSPYPWKVLGALGQLPVLSQIVDRTYIWVAHNRPLLMRLLP
jgi:hypothetical protein